MALSANFSACPGALANALRDVKGAATVHLVLYLLGGIAAIVVGFFIVLIVTALCERQYLSGDVEPASEPYPYAPSAYWKATRDEALNLGMRHAGDFATKKQTSMVKTL